MNKVTTINLHGNAYQLEEDGFEALRRYLDDAAAKLQANPDRTEIIADIEQAIAEKFRAILGPYKTVVSTQEVQSVIVEMGVVDAGTAGPGGDPAAQARPAGGGMAGAAANAGTAAGAPASGKRLFKLMDGAMLSGVCNGIAAYFSIDPTWVRIGFVLFTILTKGLMLLVYVAFAFILPTAFSPDEKAAASGAAFTAQEFIRRAKAGYYDGMKSFPDRQARREWKRKFRGEMREWRQNFRHEMRSGTGAWQNFPRNFAWGYRGSTFARPFLGLVRGLLLAACVIAIIAILNHGGTVVGFPPGIPIWLSVILIILIFKVVVWPIKIARYSLLHPSPWSAGLHPWFFLGDLVVWGVVVAAIIWLANGHSDKVHQAVADLPPALHRSLDDLKEWWDRR